MSIVDQTVNLLNNIEREVIESKAIADKETQTSLDEKVPTYQDMMNNKAMNVNSYGVSVESYARISKLIGRLNFHNANLRQLKVNIAKNRALFGNLFTSMNNRIEEGLISTKELVNCLQPIKDGLDNKLRFYSSVQYMLYNSRTQDLTTH